MRKFLALMLAVVLAMGAFVGLSSPANATKLESLVCTGTVHGTYTDDGAKPNKFDYKSVEVPAGESCVLKNVAVKGNVKSLHGSVDVKVLDSYVGGVVHVKGATGLTHIGQAGCKFDPAVRVNVLVYDSHDVLICYVTGHNIQVKRNDGRITVRNNKAHRIDVSNNLAYNGTSSGGHGRPDAIRLFRNVAKQHIHVFNNHPSRPIRLRHNSPTPVVR